MIMDIKLVLFEIGGNTMAKRKWSSEEVEEYRKEHNQYVIYFNKDDANFLVHKRYGSRSVKQLGTSIFMDNNFSNFSTHDLSYIFQVNVMKY